MITMLSPQKAPCWVWGSDTWKSLLAMTMTREERSAVVLFENLGLAALANKVAAEVVTRSRLLESRSIADLQRCMDQPLFSFLAEDAEDQTVGWCLHSALLSPAQWSRAFRELVECVAETRKTAMRQLSAHQDLRPFEFLVQSFASMGLRTFWVTFVPSRVPVPDCWAFQLDFIGRLDIGAGITIGLDSFPLEAVVSLCHAVLISPLAGLVLDYCGNSLGGRGVRLRKL